MATSPEAILALPSASGDSAEHVPEPAPALVPRQVLTAGTAAMATLVPRDGEVPATAWCTGGGLVLVLLEQNFALRRENRRLQFALAQLRRKRHAGPPPPRCGWPLASGSHGDDD